MLGVERCDHVQIDPDTLDTPRILIQTRALIVVTLFFVASEPGLMAT